jgi:very-short-patch-repair endonuclease
MSELEQELLFHIKALKIKRPVEEYTFAKPRRWRFDFAWVDEKIAVECEGGIWSRGRHVRPTGFINDCDKYNTATLLGWRVFRFTASHIARGDAVEMIRKALK